MQKSFAMCQLVMKDGEVIDTIVGGEKPAESLVMGVNPIAAQAINISSAKHLFVAAM